MSSTTVSVSTRTLVALTTPFIQQFSCTNIWVVTSNSTVTYGRTTTITALASNNADARFASCQPSGWDAVPQSLFRFSPAVCPSGWTYHDMATTQGSLSPYATYSTAYCCASGYDLREDLISGFLLASIDMPCYRSFDPGVTTVIATVSVTSNGSDPSPPQTFTGGIQVHEAWKISWAASDTNILSVSLPDLTSNMLVPTWVPGEVIPAGKYDRRNDTGSPGTDPAAGGLNSLVLFLEIGIPLIGVTVISLIVWCCWARRRKSKRKAQEQELSTITHRT